VSYSVKVLITALLVVAVSEVSKRNAVAGALLASIPLVSVLAMIWLHLDTGDARRISDFSLGVFWLVLPSLILFLALPALLRAGFNFYLSLAGSMLLTALAYLGMVWALGRFGIRI
jgi:hypothetical protein